MLTTPELAEVVQARPTATGENVAAIERSCLDGLGVALAATGTNVGAMLDTFAARRSSTARSRVIGSGRRLAAPDAAFVNAALMRALDFDDVGMWGHPTAVILPTLLSLAAEETVDGSALVDAYAVGLLVGTLLAEAAPRAIRERGFDYTSVIGVMAATAAACNLVRATPEVTRAAFGIAASSACGLRADTGTPVQGLHAAFAARSAVRATRLAAAGWSASADVFEQSLGYADTYLDTAAAHAGPTSGWLSVPRIRVHPGAPDVEGVICTVLNLMRRNAVGYDGVREVEVRGVPAASESLRFSAPADGDESRYSLWHLVGCAIRTSAVGLDSFADELVRSAVMTEARAKVRIEVLSSWDPRHTYRVPPVVALRLMDGTVVTGAAQLPNGMSDAALRAKFIDNAARFGAADSELLASTWQHLNRLTDLDAAMQLLVR